MTALTSWVGAVLAALGDLPTWRLLGAACAVGLLVGAASLRGER